MGQTSNFFRELVLVMRNEFMAVVERAEGKFTAFCPELPGIGGEGRTKMGSLVALRVAVVQLLDDRRESAVRSAAPGAVFETISVE